MASAAAQVESRHGRPVAQALRGRSHQPLVQGVLDVGRIVTPMLFESLLQEELGSTGGGQDRIAAAEALSATVLCESFTMHAFCDTATGPAQP